MPYKLTGTLIALIFYGFLFNFSLFSPPCPAHAQLFELSEIQNGIFFLSHKNMNITAETFLTDKYIDEDQARYFSELSIPEINTPADGNYPFTLVDHYILDSDLEIQYHYNNILCSALPQTAYLSRHNISITDYTDTKVPPTYSINKIKGRDPYTGEKVTAMHLEVYNYENTVPEILQMAPKTNWLGVEDPEGAEYVRVYVGNTYVRVDSAQVSVWLRKTEPELLKKCNPPATHTTCLHPSDIRKAPEPIRLIRLSSQNPCIGEPFFPEPPRSNCYYPLPAERSTPAATNWSYNYNLQNAASASGKASERSADNQDRDTSCPTCR